MYRKIFRCILSLTILFLSSAIFFACTFGANEETDKFEDAEPYAVVQYEIVNDGENELYNLDEVVELLESLCESKGLLVKGSCEIDDESIISITIYKTDDSVVYGQDELNSMFISYIESAEIEIRDEPNVVICSTSDIISTSADYYALSSGYVVYIDTDSVGKTALYEATSSSHMGEVIYICTVIDQEVTVISSPTIDSQISDGQVIVTGFASLEDAQYLALQISLGKYDVDLSLLDISLI